MNKNVAIACLVVVVIILGFLVLRPKSAVSPAFFTPDTIQTASTTNVQASQSSNGAQSSSSVQAVNTTVGSGTTATDTLNLVQIGGVSFTKTPDWSFTSQVYNQIVLTQNSGQWTGDTMTIQDVSGPSITDTDAKFGDVTYFYDATTMQWMTSSLDDNGNPTGAKPAHPYETVDGLPVFLGVGRWRTYIIPTTPDNFLKLTIGGSGQTEPLDALVATLTVSQ